MINTILRSNFSSSFSLRYYNLEPRGLYEHLGLRFDNLQCGNTDDTENLFYNSFYTLLEFIYDMLLKRNPMMK